MNISSTILKCLLVLTICGSAFGQFDVYRADLDQAQAGGTGSEASGEAILCLTQSQDELSINIEFDGLNTDMITACHIRLGAVGANGPRIFGLVNPTDDLDDFVELPNGYSSVWDLEDAGVSLSSQIPALQMQLLHILVFTAAFPNGEIRGQIVPVVMGDVNRDGVVDLFDVVGFVDLVTTGGYTIEADFDKNGSVDLIDTQPFVDVLTGG